MIVELVWWQFVPMVIVLTGIGLRLIIPRRKNENTRRQ
jgi:hypothetical protein